MDMQDVLVTWWHCVVVQYWQLCEQWAGAVKEHPVPVGIRKLVAIAVVEVEGGIIGRGHAEERILLLLLMEVGMAGPPKDDGLVVLLAVSKKKLIE